MNKYIIFLLIIFITGCTARVGDFSVLSTRNVDIGGDYILVGRNVEGIEKIPIVIFVPLGYPDVENAVDQALQSVEGDLMTDVVVTYQWFYIPYIYGEQKYIVKGDVWKKASKDDSTKLDEALENPSAIVLTATDKDGQLELTKTNN